ncbi:Uncharacterised protein [Mycobacterium tuberculosis]|nr:Uncharacterised protein [Mycobacterium tuberculosis]
MLTWSVRAKNQALSSITIQVSRSRGSASITPVLSNCSFRSGMSVHIEEPVRSKNVTPSTPSALITYSHCGSSTSAMITVCGVGVCADELAYRGVKEPRPANNSACSAANSRTEV